MRDPAGEPGPAYDAIVLAGGAGRRLGGADKPGVEIAGRSLLDRALEATSRAGRTTVVGPRRDTARPVGWAREEPPGAGPLAAVAAGLPTLSAPVIVVLACDMPLVDRRTVASLTAELGGDGPDAGADDGPDAAVLVDAEERRQPLAAAYRRTALSEVLAAAGDPRDRPARRLLEGLTVREVPAPEVGADCDTWEDVERIRRRAESLPPTPE